MVGVDRVPFGPLRYLYIGSSDLQKDLDYFITVLGPRKSGTFLVPELGSLLSGLVRGPCFYLLIIVPRRVAF